jgi:hypothetical protein
MFKRYFNPKTERLPPTENLYTHKMFSKFKEQNKQLGEEFLQFKMQSQRARGA